MSSEAAKKVGGFAPIRYLHDYDYIFRLLLAYPDSSYYMADSQLLKYRIHGGNTLSEGAILAREQDQMVIRKYMLEACAKGQKGIKQTRVETGLDRLIALEHELLEVKQQLQAQTSEVSLSTLSKVKRKLRGMLS